MNADRVDALSKISTATICESGGHALPSAIRPCAGRPALCGRAFTVSCPPGDNLWIHRALPLASPGDVLVCTVDGAAEHGYWGEILTIAAMEREIAGLVIDGGVRDTQQIDALGFPVFARTVCIRGTTKLADGKGSVGETIAIGDVAIRTGDLVRGDRDGLVVIPATSMEDVMNAAAARDRKEADVIDRLRAGETTLGIYGWD